MGNELGGFGGQFTTIKGVSDRRRMPLLGNIRLGVVVKNKKGLSNKCKHNKNEYCDFCSHPKDVPYFVVPDQIKNARDKHGKVIYGDQPTELDVMFPVDSLSVIFPQALKLYGKTSGLKCIGDGEKSRKWNEKTIKWADGECPCEHLKTTENPKGQCFKRANLYVILWKVDMGGVYRIISSSINTIIDVQSGLEYHKALLGRFARVPLILKRQEQEIVYTDKEGKRTKSIHYPLKIQSNITVEDVAKYRWDNARILPEVSPERIQLPEEVASDNLKVDKEAVIVTDEETERSNGKSESPKPEPTGEQNGKSKTAITEAQRKKMMILCNELKIETGIRKRLSHKYYNKISSINLTVDEASDLIEKLSDLKDGVCDLKIEPNGQPYFQYGPKEGEEQ